MEGNRRVWRLVVIAFSYPLSHALSFPVSCLHCFYLRASALATPHHLLNSPPPPPHLRSLAPASLPVCCLSGTFNVSPSVFMDVGWRPCSSYLSITLPCSSVCDLSFCAFRVLRHSWSASFWLQSFVRSISVTLPFRYGLLLHRAASRSSALPDSVLVVVSVVAARFFSFFPIVYLIKELLETFSVFFVA